MADLMQAVQDFVVEKSRPGLPAMPRFRHVWPAMFWHLCCANWIRPRFRAAEQARLEALLNETGTLEVLNRILCDKIAKGALGPEDEALMDHLKRATMGKLAIDQPTYAGYQTAQSSGWPEEG